MKPLQLQSLQPSDLEQGWQILDSWPPQERESNGFAQSRSTFELFMTKADGYLIQEESKPVGFCLIQRAADVAEILLIAVHKDQSGAGLGSRALRAIIDDLQKEQLSEVWLEVHAQNQRALAVYQKLGFQITSRRPRYYPDGGDALNLKLAFKIITC